MKVFVTVSVEIDSFDYRRLFFRQGNERGSRGRQTSPWIPCFELTLGPAVPAGGQPVPALAMTDTSQIISSENSSNIHSSAVGNLFWDEGEGLVKAC